MEILSPHSIFKQMVVTAFRLEGFANKNLFGPIGLSSTTLRILHLLLKNKTLTPTHLMNELECTKSNITQRLNHLEKNGFISRSAPSDGDQRHVSVVLTEAGKRKIFEAVKMLREKGTFLEKHFKYREKTNCMSFIKKVNRILDHYDNK